MGGRSEEEDSVLDRVPLYCSCICVSTGYRDLFPVNLDVDGSLHGLSFLCMSHLLDHN